MIFDENFANFYDFSTNFCQLADFLPRGGGPRCFVKYSPVWQPQSHHIQTTSKYYEYLTTHA